MAKTFALSAMLITPLVVLALLIPRTFTLTRCFRTASLSGCSTRPASFATMLADAPDLLAPLLVAAAVLTALAFVAYLAIVSPNPALSAVATGGYAFVVAVPTVALGPWLVAPLLLLVAAHGLALGAPARRVAGLLARVALLMGGAFAIAYLFAQAWTLRFGPFPGGGLETIWVYVALAGAAGVTAGCALSAARADASQIATGLVAGVLGYGLAGFIVSLGALRAMYPDGRYVGLGLSAVWTTLFALLLVCMLTSSLALRVIARMAVAPATGLAIAVATTSLVVGIGTFAVLGPLAVSSVAPPLLMLPSTATTP